MKASLFQVPEVTQVITKWAHSYVQLLITNVFTANKKNFSWGLHIGIKAWVNHAKNRHEERLTLAHLNRVRSSHRGSIWGQQWRQGWAYKCRIPTMQNTGISWLHNNLWCILKVDTCATCGVSPILFSEGVLQILHSPNHPIMKAEVILLPCTGNHCN